MKMQSKYHRAILYEWRSFSDTTAVHQSFLYPTFKLSFRHNVSHIASKKSSLMMRIGGIVVYHSTHIWTHDIDVI